ncbi:MAG TPA: hypothetical protein VEP90_23925, partial [Methylomirabilota bacterium]|nr:hypothetical protein [Methylomirabilota bacterium]
LVVLEINTDYILPWRLTPDEDFLEQATRKQSIEDDNGSVCSPEMGMHKRTFWYRKRLLQFRHHWEDSLKGLGNCCYHDVIPINAFTRYALLPFNSKISFAVDPCMTLMNYAIMGGYYRELTKHVFGDPLDLTADCQMEYIARLPRDNVEVRKMKT